MATSFPERARRDDQNGHMVVQRMLEFLRDEFDKRVALTKRGTSTVPAGQPNVVVSHGIGTASYAASITPTVDPTLRYWVSNKTSSQLQINLSGNAPVGGVSFDWIVQGG